MQREILATLIKALKDNDREEMKKGYFRIHLMAHPQDATDDPFGISVFVDNVDLIDAPEDLKKLMKDKFFKAIGIG